MQKGSFSGDESRYVRCGLCYCCGGALGELWSPVCPSHGSAQSPVGIELGWEAELLLSFEPL